LQQKLCFDVSQSDLSIADVYQATLTVPVSHWLMSTPVMQHVSIVGHMTCFQPMMVQLF